MRMRFVLHKFETIFYAQELRLTHMIATRVYSVRLCVCVCLCFWPCGEHGPHVNWETSSGRQTDNGLLHINLHSNFFFFGV